MSIKMITKTTGKQNGIQTRFFSFIVFAKKYLFTLPIHKSQVLKGNCTGTKISLLQTTSMNVILHNDIYQSQNEINERYSSALIML